MGWQGFGGSAFQWHPGLKVSFAYAPTRLGWDDPVNARAARLQEAVVKCVMEGQLKPE